MHRELERIRRAFVGNVRENLETLEIRRPEPLVAAALAVSPQPLAVREIVALGGQPVKTVEQALERMVERGLVRRSGGAGKAAVRFELHQDLEVLARQRFRERVEKVARKNASFLGASRKAIQDCLEGLDPADRLYARMLLSQLKGLEKMNLLALKAIFLAQWLEGEVSAPDSLRSVRIK